MSTRKARSWTPTNPVPRRCTPRHARAIAEIKDAWEKKFGLVYKAENDRGITWEAESPTVRSTITVWGPKVADCTNKSLEAQAMKAAMSSM